MSTRTPNPEQLKAITHQGGVLLKAGAGSGKTFVLVEHIVYLVDQWITESESINPLQSEIHLKRKFSSTVMMTFTRKAAGEMKIRLMERFEKLALEESRWAAALEYLPLMNVTTIDGFCRKIISQGYFPGISSEVDIVSGLKREDQVQNIFSKWCESNNDLLQSAGFEAILREKNKFIRSLVSIFSRAELRLVWKKFSPQAANPLNVGEILRASHQLNSIQAFLEYLASIDLPDLKERSAFEKMLSEFQNLRIMQVNEISELNSLYDFFASRTLRGESSKNKKSEIYDNALEALKKLREWSRKWKEPLHSYEQHFHEIILPWITLCANIFNHIEDHLDPNEGMTFGDLTYWVCRGLEDHAIRSRIAGKYRYFIIDEFQDTSPLQYEIVKNLTEGDLSRLFCVGDVKQAIYGFRGGELAVFQECEKEISKVMQLEFNYRSLGKIIAFNNSLFSTILPLTKDLDGVDPFSVKPEDQVIPSADLESLGEVCIFNSPISDSFKIPAEKKKYTTDQVNYAEALGIIGQIKSIKSNNSDEVCTILYRKLAPSHDLIELLIENNIGFTAQYKIDFTDEPIIGLFLILMKRQMDKNPLSRDEYPLLMIEAYLRVLGIEKKIFQERLRQFDLDLHFWGPVDAFRKFVFSLGITNENADQNLSEMEKISQLCFQNHELLVLHLTTSSDTKMNMELRYGVHSSKVRLMSAHASKGLEFDHVILAGIYTNGREQSDHDIFGDYPASFKWLAEASSRTRIPSPWYLWEKEIESYKSFSESKRLLYVACTRAVRRLIWIDLSLNQGDFSVPGGSWIQVLNFWRQDLSHSGLVQVSEYVRPETSDFSDKRKSPDVPLFFHSDSGIFPKDGASAELLLTSELSVTRLLDLLDCPRKFYLSHILSLEAPEISQHQFFEGSKMSSKKRGTFIHQQVALKLKNGESLEHLDLSLPDMTAIQWILKQLEIFKEDHNLISEKNIKFKIFNYMITGIPDLIVQNRESGHVDIWDFKTGDYDEGALKHYWFQLYCYAYAVYIQDLIPKDTSIKLTLCFPDLQKLLTKTIDWSECKESLYPTWIRQNTPWVCNLDHCGQCSYGSICPR